MFSRLFSPAVTARLFDPMPLPKTLRVRHAGRMRAPKNRVTFTGIDLTKKGFMRTVKKIPTHR